MWYRKHKGTVEGGGFPHERLHQEAIFFYLSFFPAFLDLENVSLLDAIIVMAIATVAVGGVKVGYVYLGDRAKFLRQSSGMRRRINLTAGSVLVVSGVFLLIKK